MKFKVVLFLLILAYFTNAQTNKVSKFVTDNFELSIAPKFGGVSLMSMSFDLYVAKSVDLEMMIMTSGVGGGLYYHLNPFRESKFNIYGGIATSKYRPLSYLHIENLYFPVGINYYSKDEFLNVAFDIGFLKSKRNYDKHNFLFKQFEAKTVLADKFSVSIKVGVRF